MVCQMAPFSVTLNDPYPTPGFKVTPFFDAECLRNGTTYRHSFNGILIGTYTRPSQQCHFEWPSVTLSDLAKICNDTKRARSLCDSWASCTGIRETFKTKLQQPSRSSNGRMPCIRFPLKNIITSSSAVAKRPRVLRVIEYFAKSLKVTQDHSKWHCWVGLM